MILSRSIFVALVLVVVVVDGVVATVGEWVVVGAVVNAFPSDFSFGFAVAI